MEQKSEEQSECEKFLGLVQLLLDNEADQSEERYITEHMDDCAPCFQHMETERQFKELVQQKIDKKEVPLELIQTIETKIKALVSPA